MQATEHLRRALGVLAAAALLSAGQASAAVIGLFEYGINIDGVSSFPVKAASPLDPVPSAADVSSFNDQTGLGTITVTVTGAGAHYAGLLVDHEIDESLNTFFNETGFASGVPGAGQSWEIDEPGYVAGDIDDNFLAGTLDNGIGTSPPPGPTTFPDDVSMALAYNFALASGETAIVTWLVAELLPIGGFHLEQYDLDSDASIFFSSTLAITDTPPAPLPEPGTLALLAISFLGPGFARKRRTH